MLLIGMVGSMVKSFPGAAGKRIITDEPFLRQNQKKLRQSKDLFRGLFRCLGTEQIQKFKTFVCPVSSCVSVLIC